MPQQDKDAGKLHHAQIVLQMTFVSRDNPFVVLYPGIESFNLPSRLYRCSLRPSCVKDGHCLAQLSPSQWHVYVKQLRKVLHRIESVK